MAQKGPVVPPARASCRDPIERVNLLRAPATLVTLMIAAQGLTPTPSSATSELPRQYDLIRLVAFSLTLLAAKLLAYITGYSFTSNDKYKVSYLWHGVVLTEATGDAECVIWDG